MESFGKGVILLQVSVADDDELLSDGNLGY